jgi:hypothetical protein
MKITSPDNRGWVKVKKAAKSYTALDEYLRGFEVRDNQVDEIVDEVMEEFGCSKKAKRTR